MHSYPRVCKVVCIQNQLLNMVKLDGFRSYEGVTLQFLA